MPQQAVLVSDITGPDCYEVGKIHSSGILLLGSIAILIFRYGPLGAAQLVVLSYVIEVYVDCRLGDRS